MWNCMGLEGKRSAGAHVVRGIGDLRNAQPRGQMGPVGWDKGKLVGVGNEDGVDITFESGESIGTKILWWSGGGFAIRGG